MKKLNKMRMVRPADALLPLALLIVSALGRSDMAENVFIYTWLSRLFALASCRGLRQAFSEQPSMRKVTGSVKAALPLQIIGALAVALIHLARNGGRYSTSILIYIGMGLCLNIEHVFYEYLHATGDGHSAAMCRAITSALTLGGLLLTGTSSRAGLLPYGLEWPLGAAAASAGVSAIIGLTVGGPLKGKINGQVVKCAPLALAQSLIYPLLWLAAALIPDSPMRLTLTAAPLFAGLTAYELCRAPFRRTPMESRPMNRTLAVVCIVSLVCLGLYLVPTVQAALKGILHGYFYDLPASLAMIAAGCACGFGMFGKIRFSSPDV